MKKFFASIALMGMFTMNASAQFAGGTGTESDPYQVATAEQLQAVNDFLSSSFVQTEDIDLTDIVWKPIGTFTGHYNGQGHRAGHGYIRKLLSCLRPFRHLHEMGKRRLY